MTFKRFIALLLSCTTLVLITPVLIADMISRKSLTSNPLTALMHITLILMVVVLIVVLLEEEKSIY